jgi:hypothetical protein
VHDGERCACYFRKKSRLGNKACEYSGPALGRLVEKEARSRITPRHGLGEDFPLLELKQGFDSPEQRVLHRR